MSDLDKIRDDVEMRLVLVRKIYKLKKKDLKMMKDTGVLTDLSKREINLNNST